MSVSPAPAEYVVSLSTSSAKPGGLPETPVQGAAELKPAWGDGVSSWRGLSAWNVPPAPGRTRISSHLFEPAKAVAPKSRPTVNRPVETGTSSRAAVVPTCDPPAAESNSRNSKSNGPLAGLPASASRPWYVNAVPAGVWAATGRLASSSRPAATTIRSDGRERIYRRNAGGGGSVVFCISLTMK